jgi:hypothetical protein
MVHGTYHIHLDLSSPSISHCVQPATSSRAANHIPPTVLQAPSGQVKLDCCRSVGPTIHQSTTRLSTTRLPSYPSYHTPPTVLQAPSGQVKLDCCSSVGSNSPSNQRLRPTRSRAPTTSSQQSCRRLRKKFRTNSTAVMMLALLLFDHGHLNGNISKVISTFIFLGLFWLAVKSFGSTDRWMLVSCLLVKSFCSTTLFVRPLFSALLVKSFCSASS